MKKTVSLVLIISMVMMFTTGCSQEKQTANDTPAQDTGTSTQNANESKTVADVSKEGKPIELDIVIRHIGFTTNNDNAIAKELNERLNMNINWILKPSENYPQQCSILIASGDYPDAMEYWCSQYPNELQQMADDGIIRPVDELIAKFGPEFTEEVRPDFTWFVSQTDGKRYAIPCRFNEMRNGTVLQIRSDWLKKLNLEVPDSSEELFKVLTAFKENSDLLVGKGNQLIPYGGIQGWDDGLRQHIFSENGFISDWNEVGDEAVYFVNMPGYREALRTLRKFYQAGLIEPEWPLMNREQYLEKWYKNMYGCWQNYIDNLDPESSVYMPNYLAAVPEAETEFIYPFPDKDGARRVKGALHRMQAIIFTETPDEKAEAVVKLMNYMISEEGSDLVEMGIKGVHWDEDENGKAIFTAPSENDQKAEMGYYSYNWFCKRLYFPRWNSDVTLNAGREFAKFAVYPAVDATTPAALENGAVLSDIVKSSETELICSTEIKDFDAAFDEYIKKWNESGGAQWTKEMNEVYRQQRKK